MSPPATADLRSGGGGWLCPLFHVKHMVEGGWGEELGFT